MTKKYKVYLDDIRIEPDGWYRTKTADETIDFLKENIENVEIISLDHDLAFEHYSNNYDKEKTGYDVLLWIEEQVFTNKDFVLPKILIHTDNPSARVKMEQCLEKILIQHNKNMNNKLNVKYIDVGKMSKREAEVNINRVIPNSKRIIFSKVSNYCQLSVMCLGIVWFLYAIILE